MKQVIFLDNEGTVHAGIALEDGGVICGCCGGYIEPDDCAILYTYSDWMNIEAEICGDDNDKLFEISEKIDKLSPEEVRSILKREAEFE